MQQSFLEYVLQNLQQKGVPILAYTFVLPSKRSGTFLKNYISQNLDKTVFSPQILSIEDFVTQLSGLNKISNVDALLSLYKVYKQCKVKEHDDFDTFLKWGQTLLQDFNEIDRYLIPSKDILNYLSAVKELNHWSLQQEKSDLVQNYLALWGLLSELYDAFTTQLLEHEKGYQGLIYRKAADHIESGIDPFRNTRIVFVGFNALNTAEIRIIQHYLGHPGNHIYWDIDSYFLEDPVHDAGLFIRNYKKNWPYYQNRSLEGLHQSFLQTRNINITGVPKSISQAQYVGNLLKRVQNGSEDGIQNTALVLADESLLVPILQSIPAEVAQVNITMGLPLNKTVLYTFFLSFLDLQLNRSERGWYFEELLAFFSNPYCRTLSATEEVDVCSRIGNDIKKENKLYLRPQDIQHYRDQSNLVPILFPNAPLPAKDWISLCLQLVQHLKEDAQVQHKTLELEYLYRFYGLFNQLQQQLAETDIPIPLKSVKSFFKQLAALETTDFIGEPLSGPQIMGMLESRNLDFETVIITSVNEGILPSGKSNNSFFPFDIKREFGLPTYKEKDAIYTYHFYRLIQRAKNVYILYNTEPDVLEGGEKSRLVAQLLTDNNLSGYITHTIASPEVSIAAKDPVNIEKSDKLLQDIEAFAQNGFSPTSLTNFIRNPMDFYKKNLLKVYDTEEVEESIAANTFGTIIHDSLEALYRPFLDKVLQKEYMKSIQNRIPEVVQTNFAKTLPGVDIKKGRYLLVYSVIQKYLQNYVSMETKVLQKHEVKLLALEEKYESIMHIPGIDFPVKLKGTLDRVDLFDGAIRIVDYKTGRVSAGQVKIKNWEDLITNYDKSKAFQLLCYAYLYHKKYNTDNIVAGLFSFKNLSLGFLPFSARDTLITQETLRTFEGHLHQLIKDICDPEVPFMEKEV
nr:PD-(D/E)XK nuclease family protein [Allomuricauda sp.]